MNTPAAWTEKNSIASVKKTPGIRSTPKTLGAIQRPRHRDISAMSGTAAAATANMPRPKIRTQSKDSTVSIRILLWRI